jgi:hypothetical protein
MGNLFVAIPAPAANGSGAAVDVSAFGAKKTFTVANASVAHVTIEMSNEAVPVHWAPVWTFQQPNDKTVDVASRWVRATVSNYKPGGPAPVVNLAGNDDGATMATLVAPAADGAGAAVDVSLLPELKTVHIAEQFRGALQVEISADGGVTWNSVYSFQDPGQQSQVFTANRMRVVRNGVTPGGPLPLVNIAATVPGGGGSGGGPSGAAMVPFQYTVTGAEPDLANLTIPLPAARTSINYGVVVTQGTFTNLLACAVPIATKTLVNFVLSLSSAATAGDTFNFVVGDF